MPVWDRARELRRNAVKGRERPASSNQTLLTGRLFAGRCRFPACEWNALAVGAIADTSGARAHTSSILIPASESLRRVRSGSTRISSLSAPAIASRTASFSSRRYPAIN